MSLGIRLRQKRKNLKMTQKELAKMIGVSAVAVTQWETEVTSPGGKNLYTLCNAIGCKPSWLIYGDNPPKPESNAVWMGPIDVWDEDTEIIEDGEVEIPFLTQIELSAGYGQYAIEESTTKKLRFLKSTLRKQGVSPENARCVNVTGTSMEPIIPDGTVVGVDKGKSIVVDGKLYAINHNGLLRLKIAYRTPDGGLKLRSYNKEEYPDELYDATDAQQITIIGKIFWYSVLL